MGQAIVRRVAYQSSILLADINEQSAQAVRDDLKDAGFDAHSSSVDVTSTESVSSLVKLATSMGKVKGLIHAAGVSPALAPASVILKVNLYGTALVLHEFGKVIEAGGSAVVIASQAGHRLDQVSSDQKTQLAKSTVEELLSLDLIKEKRFQESLQAYSLANYGISARAMAEAVRWGERRARVNTISPGVVSTPLGQKELSGPDGQKYKKMIEACPARRAGTPDEIGSLGAFLMGPESGFITGSDFLIDGGMTASYWFGEDC